MMYVLTDISLIEKFQGITCVILLLCMTLDIKNDRIIYEHFLLDKYMLYLKIDTG